MSKDNTQAADGPPLAARTGSVTEDYDDEGCYRCGGKGYIVTCIDDLCRVQDECIHGDGEYPCPVCCGESPNAPASTTGQDGLRCKYCGRDECECSDADVASDMGAK